MGYYKWYEVQNHGLKEPDTSTIRWAITWRHIDWRQPWKRDIRVNWLMV